MCELLRGAGVVYDGGMDTLEDIYAAMMREPEVARCAKPDEGGAGDTLEALYAQRIAEDEAVRAANPYGCNQYGEGWKMPHNGMSRVPRGSIPKGGGAGAGAGSDGGGKSGEKPAEVRKKAKVLKGMSNPQEFIRAAGLTMDADDSVEVLGAFLDGLRNRHPENVKEYERIVSKISSTNGRTKAEKAASVKRIEDQLKEMLSMCSPEVVKGMSDVVVREHASMKFGVAGAYYVKGSRKIPERHIEYKSGIANNETLIHEFVHHIHACSSNETWNNITDYFRERTKGEKGQAIYGGTWGKPNHFAVTFAPRDNYAGRIYGQETYEVRDGKAETRKRWNSQECGTEMVTRHLQKLALPAADFAKYWNDKQDGKYYWREAFVTSLNLLLNP